MKRPIIPFASRIGFALITGGGFALVPALALAQSPLDVDSFDCSRHMMGWGGGGMIVGSILIIVTLAVAIAFAGLLMRWLAGPWHGAHHHAPLGRSALDILRDRYARGEIDKAEFEERRRTLGN